MNKRTTRIVIGAAIFAVSVLLPESLGILRLGAFLVAYAVVGYKVIWKAVKGSLNGQMLDENFLMAIASMGAFFVGEYHEAVAVMLFYQVGEAFEEYAVGKSRRSIAQLMNIRPDKANLKTEDGIVEVRPSKVKVGDIVIIKPGEKVPLDGIVIEGASALDTAALTGESLPRDIAEGDEILSGCINLSGLLSVKVTKRFGESTVNKILDLVENAANKKAKTENFITRFAVIYTPVVVACAVALAVLPPLLIEGASWSDWIYRALNFLVVSCPCALVISVPLSFFGGIGGASKAGVLVKGSNYLEAMAHTECVVMDKTGTLTEGTFRVEKILPEEDFTAEKLLEAAAKAEYYSSHPIALSLRKAYGKIVEESQIGDVKEFAGEGLVAEVGCNQVACGNGRLMMRVASYTGELPSLPGGTQVYVAVNGKYAGCIMLADRIKEDAANAIADLKKAGIKTVMLTGDSLEAGCKVADAVGIDRIYAGLLPQDKVALMEELLAQKSSGGKVVFVGDGINDAPVLAIADVGVAMGAMGSDAAIEAADMVIMNDDPSKLCKMIDVSKKTMRIVRQNIIFAIGIKIGVMILSALGITGLWAAVFADVGVAVLAILNALRCLK